MSNQPEFVSPVEERWVTTLQEKGQYNGRIKELHQEFRKVELECVNLSEQHSYLDDRCIEGRTKEEQSWERFKSEVSTVLDDSEMWNF